MISQNIGADNVPLPNSEKNKWKWNFFAGLSLVTITLVSWWLSDSASTTLFFPLIVAAGAFSKATRQIRSPHIAIVDGQLVAYSLPVGLGQMPVNSIGSIQYRPSSGSGWLQNKERFVVRHNRYERQLEVPVLTASQRPLLEAFFKHHFPEQYQEPAHLPGFPPARE